MLSATAREGNEEEVTYHIKFDAKDVSDINADGQVTVSIDEDDMLDLYFSLKDYKCGYVDPEVIK